MEVSFFKLEIPNTPSSDTVRKCSKNQEFSNARIWRVGLNLGQIELLGFYVLLKYKISRLEIFEKYQIF